MCSLNFPSIYFIKRKIAACKQEGVRCIEVSNYYLQCHKTVSANECFEFPYCLILRFNIFAVSELCLLVKV